MKKRLIIESLSGKSKNIDIRVGAHEDVTILITGFGYPGDKKVSVTLEGRDASAQILGMLVVKRGVSSLRTIQNHISPGATSDLLIKSVMLGEARLTYDGLIKIERGAQQSNAYQRNENLLLHEKAYVESKPELEILANDVRCTHGATIGMIDEEVLYYLMSRGINKQEATHLIAGGFFESVLERIPDVSKADKIRKQIKKELEKI